MEQSGREGWIRFDLATTSKPWWGDPFALALWMHILASVGTLPRTAKNGIPLRAGQMVFSYRSMAEDCGMTLQNLRTALGKLVRFGAVEVEEVKLPRPTRNVKNCSILTLLESEKCNTATNTATNTAKQLERCGITELTPTATNTATNTARPGAPISNNILINYDDEGGGENFQAEGVVATLTAAASPMRAAQWARLCGKERLAPAELQALYADFALSVGDRRQRHDTDGEILQHFAAWLPYHAAALKAAANQTSNSNGKATAINRGRDANNAAARADRLKAYAEYAREHFNVKP